MTQPGQPWYPKISKELHPEAQNLFRLLFGANNDSQQSIILLNNKIASLQSTVNSKIPSSSSSAGSLVTATQATTIATNQANNVIAATFGKVNYQTASYTTQTSDYGGFIQMDSASATTVTLNPSVATGWFAFFDNIGTGTATLTPGTPASGAPGTINGNANLPLVQNQGAIVGFDGVNWVAIPISFAAGGGVTSLDSITGAITLVAGTGIAIADNTPSAGDIKISAIGVTSVDSITGAVTLVAGSGITITDNTPSAGDITIASTGGGGTYLKGTVTINLTATSGTFFGTATVTGATTSMGAIMLVPTGSVINPNVSFIQGNLTASVNSSNTVSCAVTISGFASPPGNVTFNVVVFS